MFESHTRMPMAAAIAIQLVFLYGLLSLGLDLIGWLS